MFSLGVGLSIRSKTIKLFKILLTPCIQRSRDISLSRVVFPAPVGPVKTVTSPRLNPFRMWFNFGNRVHYEN